jgi:uncharacterized protein YgiB involved in biofilm formation
MHGKPRKSSARVTLVLIGVAAVLSACGDDENLRRDVYKSREDCLADWANKPSDCTPATQPNHSGFWYGPIYPYRTSGGSSWRPNSRAISSSNVSSGSHSSVSRGGFGSSARSSGG